MNYENFCKVLAKIEADPSCWDQASWFENCFIGIAADMQGEMPGVRRSNRGREFLGIPHETECAWLGSSVLKLDHFRRIRYVEGTRRAFAQLQGA